MSAMARGGQWQRALALLEAMPQEMLETPIVTGMSRACHTGLGELGGPCSDHVTVMTQESQERIVFDEETRHNLGLPTMVAVCLYILLLPIAGLLKRFLPSMFELFPCPARLPLRGRSSHHSHSRSLRPLIPASSSSHPHPGPRHHLHPCHHNHEHDEHDEHDEYDPHHGLYILVSSASTTCHDCCKKNVLGTLWALPVQNIIVRKRHLSRKASPPTTSRGFISFFSNFCVFPG